MASTMKAVVWQGVESIAVRDDVARPAIVDALDAIVAVRWAGLCGSDLHLYHGHERPDVGTVMGHELVGTVVELGPGYSDGERSLRVGDRVVCPFTTNCGDCEPCRRALTARCLHSRLLGWTLDGRGLAGAQAQFVRVPHARSSLVLLPDHVPLLPEHLFLADILPTGYECATRGRIEDALAAAHRLQLPLNIAVVGLGPVGIMALLSVRYFLRRAASPLRHRLVAVDAVADRLDFVRRHFPDVHAVSSHADADQLAPATFHLVFEAVGGQSSPGLALAFRLSAPGATISSVGVHTPSAQPFPFSAVDCYDKNATMSFGRCSARALIPTLLPLMLDNAFDFDFASLISHTVPLRHDDVVAAYHQFAQRKSMKIVFSIDDSISSI